MYADEYAESALRIARSRAHYYNHVIRNYALLEAWNVSGNRNTYASA